MQTSTTAPRTATSALIERRTTTRRTVTSRVPLPVLAPAREIVTGTAPHEHTMGAALPKYVLPKVPQAVLESGLPIHVTGAHSLDELAGGKSGKPFNWRRPSFEVTADEIICRVTPGPAYALHYAHLIATAAAVSGAQTEVTWTCPTDYDSRGFIARTLPALPHADVVMLGYVERLELGDAADQEWTKVPGWGWKLTEVDGKSVLLLGCEFSFWGDVSGQVVRELLGRGVTEWVVYVGKLGALNPAIVPNRALATGTESTLETGECVRWQGRLTEHFRTAAETDGRVVADARHATVPSVVQETKQWLATAAATQDLVDPEIGHMGRAAAEAGAHFDYLHLVTDNLSAEYGVGLYDERADHIKSDRIALMHLATDLLRSGLESL